MYACPSFRGYLHIDSFPVAKALPFFLRRTLEISVKKNKADETEFFLVPKIVPSWTCRAQGRSAEQVESQSTMEPLDSVQWEGIVYKVN